jgi:hypothetical protein
VETKQRKKYPEAAAERGRDLRALGVENANLALWRPQRSLARRGCARGAATRPREGILPSQRRGEAQRVRLFKDKAADNENPQAAEERGRDLRGLGGKNANPAKPATAAQSRFARKRRRPSYG